MMPKYIINGGKKLIGEIQIQGAKNAVLPLLAAALLTDEAVTIRNCPNLVDVNNMIRIISALGARVVRTGDIIQITSDGLFAHEIPKHQAKELRSSVFLLGSVLGRMKKAKVAYPGGCDIGLRPIDLHLKALLELNVRIVEKYGYINCDASNMIPTALTLDYPSVGATENVMLLAAISNGVTALANAAREPEIVDLQNFLNSMGAKISGAGTSYIRIEGVKHLKGADYTAMPDRIVAGTYLIATAICGGCVDLVNVEPGHLQSLLSKLMKSGCDIDIKANKISITSNGNIQAFGIVETQPYPGYPTDLQAQLTALATVANGTTIISENIFENRYKFVPELNKMGAQVMVKGKFAFVTGVSKLTGAETYAMDLRGGAALVLAGLNAEQTTVVHDIHHIERGYEELDVVLKKLGCDIIRL
ncbi:MAG: UDP-N-acetylglucosamine 1-carboxyvinyltransferase [Christensenellaceae bacterium]|jgi:UDP-N-acetylglucosamine 1-carboxyvinyltransferase|nr:UDP-N-acetylglucosamine 1-carboxyvinyltransferase [Christensenellaceae bacterium]